MGYAPKNGGVDNKPTDTAPALSGQKYYGANCTTLVTAYALNEVIINDINAKNYLGVTNLPNDDNSLKKMFEAVLTGKKGFSTANVLIYNTIQESIITQNHLGFYKSNGQLFGRIGLTEINDDYLYISKRNGTQNTSIILMRDEQFEFNKKILANEFSEYQTGYGIRFNNDIRALTGRICLGTDQAQDRIEFSESENTLRFFENNNDRGMTLLAGNADFNYGTFHVDLNVKNKLYLWDNSATNETLANPYMDFVWGDNKTRLGWIGYGSTDHTKLTIKNDVGELEFTSSEQKHRFNGEVYAAVFDGELSGNADTATLSQDSAKLNGKAGSHYLDASNINAGTLSDARLPTTISSNITGSANSLSTTNGTPLTFFKEGVFTPTINCFSAIEAGSGGRYQRIGDVMSVSIYLLLDNAKRTGSTSAEISIGGVPYLSEVTTFKASLLNVNIDDGFYAFENYLGALFAQVDATSNTIKLIRHHEDNRMQNLLLSELATWTGSKAIRISGQIFMF